MIIMKTLLKKFPVQVFVGMIFFLGGLISSGACHGPYYQPVVPEKLRKK